MTIINFEDREFGLDQRDKGEGFVNNPIGIEPISPGVVTMWLTQEDGSEEGYLMSAAELKFAYDVAVGNMWLEDYDV